MTRDREYFCPISHTCPHWLDVCRDRGCQHPDAVEMRGEAVFHHPGHITFPPGPAGYTHGDGNDGVPWLQRVVVWGAGIALVVLIAPAVAVVVIGVVGVLMGLR